MNKKHGFIFIVIFLASVALPFSNRPDTNIAAICKAGKVTVEELSTAVDRSIRQFKRVSPEKVYTPEEMAEIESSTLTDLILRKIFLRMAEKEKISVLDSEVKERYFIVCSGLFDNDEKAFLSALKQDGWTESEYMKNLKEIIISEKVRTKVTGDIEVSDKEAKAYYDSHKIEFEAEEIELAHILIMAPERDEPNRGLKTVKTELIEKNVKPESLDVKASEEMNRRRVKLETILDSLKRGADFSLMASRYSEDGTKTQGGSLGLVPRGRTVKIFEETGFALKKGEISGIIQTEFGFHIIKALLDKKTRVQEFSEVVSSLTAKLRAERESERLSELEKKWNVKRFGIIKKGK